MCAAKIVTNAGTNNILILIVRKTKHCKVVLLTKPVKILTTTMNGLPVVGISYHCGRVRFET